MAGMAGHGGRRSRARTLALLLLACLLLGGACSDGDGDGDRVDPPTEPAAPEPRTIAFLRAVQSSQPENQAAFLDELAGAGYRKGENLTIHAEDLAEVYPDDAAATAAVQKWVAEGVDLIIALSTVGARVAAATAPDTNVLFLVNDPISAGLVDDRRHPSGRLTGATFGVPPDRTLDVTRRALPGITSVGAVYPPSDPAALALAESAEAAAATLGIGLIEATFTGADDAAAAVESLRDQGVGAIWVLNSPTSIRFIQPLAATATAASLPIVSNTTVAAATVTLQPDTQELYRQIARQALELFEGVPVADIPVEDPSAFLVEVNLASAAAIGLELPPAFVDSADRVIR
jgi:putative tryptophan/tyrosine transport system substrate-binding protein